MTSEGNITRVSAAELRARGRGHSDLARVRAKTEEELERDIESDPDLRDIPRDWYKTAAAVWPAPKKLLSLRLDPDVVEWFKAQGPGYQTRINAALVAFMRASRKAGV